MDLDSGPEGYGMQRSGAPGEIRTPDLMLRRHSLYPAELRARSIRIAHFAFLNGIQEFLAAYHVNAVSRFAQFATCSTWKLPSTCFSRSVPIPPGWLKSTPW